MKIIVLEGPDGAGKTTLAQTFREYFRYDVWCCGPPTPGIPEMKRNTSLITSAGRSPARTVFDRLHIGELVYGSITRGKSQLSLDDLDELDKLIHDAGGITILCLPPYELCEKSFEKKRTGRGEYLKTKEQLRKVYDYYQLIAEWRGTNYVIYDYNKTSCFWITSILEVCDTAMEARRIFNA